MIFCCPCSVVAFRLIAPPVGSTAPTEPSSNRNWTRVRVRVRVKVRVSVRVSIRRKMRLGEMRRYALYTYLRSAKKMVQIKWWTTKQSLSRKQKTTKQVVVVGPPIKGKMRLGKMLPNRPCRWPNIKAFQSYGSETWVVYNKLGHRRLCWTRRQQRNVLWGKCVSVLCRLCWTMSYLCQ